MTIEDAHGRSSRRGFSKGLGAAGAGLVAGSVGAAGATADQAVRPLAPGSYARSGAGAPGSSIDFGRIFPGLPPFADASGPVRAALLEVGMPGGIMDARDQLSAAIAAQLPLYTRNPSDLVGLPRVLDVVGVDTGPADAVR